MHRFLAPHQTPTTLLTARDDNSEHNFETKQTTVRFGKTTWGGTTQIKKIVRKKTRKAKKNAPLLTDNESVKRRERYAKDAPWRNKKRKGARERRRAARGTGVGKHYEICSNETLMRMGHNRTVVYPKTKEESTELTLTREDLGTALGGFRPTSIGRWIARGWLAAPVLQVKPEGKGMPVKVYSLDEAKAIVAVLREHFKECWYVRREHFETISKLQNCVVALRKVSEEIRMEQDTARMEALVDEDGDEPTSQYVLETLGFDPDDKDMLDDEKAFKDKPIHKAMKKKQNKRKHKVKASFQVVELSRAGSALTLEIFADAEKIGTVQIGRGSFTWIGGKKQTATRISWSDFANLLDQHCYSDRKQKFQSMSLGELADEGNKAAKKILMRRAKAYGVDHNDWPTWTGFEKRHPEDKAK